MAKPAAQIQVEGLRDVRNAVRKLKSKELNDALKRSNKESAEIVAEAARTGDEVPVNSGRLKKSIKASGSQASGSVKAGTAARVPYAGVIHWGWPERNIKPQPFLSEALADKIDIVTETFEELFSEVLRILESEQANFSGGTLRGRRRR